LDIERGSTISHSTKNSLWKRLWTCRKTNNKATNDIYAINNKREASVINTLRTGDADLRFYIATLQDG